MSQTSLVTDYASALEFLLGRVNYERTTAIPYRAATFKLDRMRRLLELLGDPHLALKAIHIAGTKGKGSTAAMVAAVLAAAGYKTALYTSPHLDVTEERIVVDGQQCGQDQFVALAAEVAEATSQMAARDIAGELGPPTFFEVTTAMAFLHFARQQVQAAVLEVGLGGRLDSTNVCRPSVTIITSISFDHMRQLGNTLAAIAGEKAGIIKPGVPIISGVVKPEPRAVIHEVAREQQAPLFQRGVDYDWDQSPAPANSTVEGAAAEWLHYREPASQPQWRLEGVRLGMLGQHQAANAATAIAAIRRLNEQGWNIPETAIRLGLAAARCPARIEVVAEKPTVILDVAHNVASIEALVDVLRERFPARRRVLVFASSRDKETADMLRILLPQFDEVVLTRYIHNPRAVEIETLQSLAAAEMAAGLSSGLPHRPPVLHASATPAEAWNLACKLASPDDLICITGSFFLAAELRPLLAEARLTPVAKL